MLLGYLFGFALGTGIGAYNTHHLKVCLDDTFHIGKQKAKPHMEKVAALGEEHFSSGMAYARQASATLQEKAKSAMCNN